MTRVRADFIDEVSAGRLGEAALKGLATLPPQGAIGRSLEGTGLIPDVEVEPDHDTDPNPGDPIRDVQLRRAIDIVGASSSR